MIGSKSLRVVPLLVALVSAPALAQVPGYSASTDPAAQLSANLMILSQNPRDVNALLGAGRSAIAVGDGNAALSFLARAEEISPRDGRIKAALGAALVMLERPAEALRLFSEATQLGVAEGSIAGDRGLAYDLRGDSRRAQRDYLLAQRHAPSDETTRRLALSVGISGDRDYALKLLDPLLRKQDQAAWRARAFVLAMTGDVAGAEGVARSVMPAGASETMTPFLRRLASLNAAERALAVNFGTMPSDGQRLASVETGDPFRPVGSGTAVPGGSLIPAGEPLGRAEDAKPARPVVTVSKEPRRRPGSAAAITSRTLDAGQSATPRPGFSTDTQVALATPPRASQRIERRIETRIGPVQSERLPPEVRARLTPPAPVPKPLAATSAGAGQPVTITPPPASAPVVVEAVPQPSPPPVPAPAFEIPAPVVTAPARIAIADVALPPSVVAGDAAGSFSLPPSQGTATTAPPPAVVNQAERTVASAQIAAALPASAPPAASPLQLVPAPQAAPPAGAALQPAPAPGISGIAQIIATIEPEPESAPAPLPTAAELRAARVAAQRKAEAQAKADATAKAAKDAKTAQALAAKRHPPRIWVQVATGSNEAGLPSTWKKLRDKSPATFKGLSAASVPYRATNRLLVGPMRSQAEARALLGAMQKAGMSGTTYASEAGQEVAKIAAR